MSVPYSVALERLQALFPELPAAKVELMLVRGLEEAEADRFREQVEADLAQLSVIKSGPSHPAPSAKTTSIASRRPAGGLSGGGAGTRCCGDPADCEGCA